MRWLQFILSHSIFISLCALSLCFQTLQLLHVKNDPYLFGLVFFATLSSYNFYWLISKYHFSQDLSLAEFLVKNISNLLLFILASAGVLYCMLSLPSIGMYISVAVLLTLLYSVPLWPFRVFAFARKVGFLKTILLAFTWAYVTVVIPVAHVKAINGTALALLFTARFLFMLMLCIIFDSRDIAVDKIHSLRSLATDVSTHALQRIMAVVFILYLLSGCLLRWYFDDTAQLVAFIITGLVTRWVYRLSLKKQGYFFYYFIVDGLMLFSATATFVASI